MIIKNTYLLTKHGWDTIQNLTVGDQIFGIEKNCMVPAEITNIIKHNYSGEVFTINKSDLLPNTRLLTKSKKLKKIKDIKNKSILASPIYTYTGKKLNPIIHKGTMYDTCLILRVIGYFVECGKIESEPTIVFTNKKNKLNIINNTLNALNIKNFISISNKGLTVTSHYKDLYDFLLQFGSGRNVHIPKEFLNLDKYYIRYLLEAIIDSSITQDAKITKNYKLEPKKGTTVITPSEKLTDNIHELAIKLGLYFNTSAIYRNPMRRKQYDPLTCRKATTFGTRIFTKRKNTPITKNLITTCYYTIYTKPKLKLILIKNKSIPMWINTNNR